MPFVVRAVVRRGITLSAAVGVMIFGISFVSMLGPVLALRLGPIGTYPRAVHYPIIMVLSGAALVVAVWKAKTASPAEQRAWSSHGPILTRNGASGKPGFSLQERRKLKYLWRFSYPPTVPLTRCSLDSCIPKCRGSSVGRAHD